MDDSDRLMDSIKDVKFTASFYSSNAADCTTPEIRNVFLKFWKDSQDHVLLFKSLLPAEYKNY